MPCLAAAAAAANVFLSECLDRRFLSAETAAEKDRERMLTDTTAAAAAVVFLFLCRSKASALGGGGGGGVGDGVGGDGHSSRAACFPAAQPCLECVR